MDETFTKKDVLAKRLAGYAAAAGAMVVLTPEADAQVVYSGLVDTVATENQLNLDLNNDGNTDFWFQFEAGSFVDYGVWGNFNGIDLYASYRSIYNSTTFGWNYFSNSFIDSNGANPAALNRGFLIGNSLPSPTYSGPYFYWNNEQRDTIAGKTRVYFSSTYTTISSTYYGGPGATNTFTYTNVNSYSSGNFLGAGEKYLGVRFFIDDHQHYGWIRLEVPSDASQLRVFDWAYQSVADSAIYTGDSIDMAASLSVDGENFVNDPVTVDITFDEMAYDLELSDFQVTNGTPSDLTVVGPVKKAGSNVGQVFTLTVTPLVPGEVKVILPDSSVSDEFGQPLMAADTVSFQWDIETKVDDAASNASIYPVPAKDILYAEAAMVSDFALISTDGRVISKQAQTLRANFDLSAMKPGLLIVEVRNQQGVARYKVVKE